MPGLPSPPDSLNPAAPSLPRRRLRSVSLTVEHPERWTPNPKPSPFEPTPTVDGNGTTASILSPRGRALVEREAEEAHKRSIVERLDTFRRAIKEEERKRKKREEELEEERKRIYDALTPAERLHWSLNNLTLELYQEWLDRVLDPYERFESAVWMFEGHWADGLADSTDW